MNRDLELRDDDDLVITMAKIAFRQYEAGTIDRARLTELLELAINARAAENGYADRFGMPFPSKSHVPRRHARGRSRWR